MRSTSSSWQRLGDAALAASSLGVSIFGLLLWTGSGLVGASAPLIAAELGRRKHAVREVRRTVRMALWLSALVAAVFMGENASVPAANAIYGRDLARIRRIDQLAATAGRLIQDEIRELSS